MNRRANASVFFRLVGMGRGASGRVAALLAMGMAGALTPGALASAPPTGWNGQNPFNCVIQNVATGTAFPHPEADPFCVEFDKTHQNVTELGVVDFLSQEPARVAAASSKCFYFQSDHWRGSLVQGDPTTKTYEFDGHYFFDKARGEGGVWVTNFNINGKTGDPSAIPGIPADYARYFGPGTGGIITHDEVQADPACVEKARTNPPYASVAGSRGCIAARGRFGGHDLGGVALGTDESGVQSLLGAPQLVRRGFARWCLQTGGSVRVGFPGDRSGSLGGAGGGHAVMVLSTNRAYRARGVGPGSTTGALRRHFRHARMRFSVAGARVWSLGAGSTRFAATRNGRVAYVGVFDRRVLASRRALRGYLRRGG